MPGLSVPTKNDTTGSPSASAIRRNDATEGLANPRSTWDRKLSSNTSVRRKSLLNRTALAALGVVLIAESTRPFVSSAPPILDRLGLGGTAQSLLVTLPVLCFALGALGGPWLRRRLGEEQAVAVLLGGMLAGLVVRALARDWPLFTGTIVAGFAVAVLNVLIRGPIKHRFAGRVGPMMAPYTVAITLGASLASGITVSDFRATGDSTGRALGISRCRWLLLSRSGSRTASPRRPGADHVRQAVPLVAISSPGT